MYWQKNGYVLCWFFLHVIVVFLLLSFLCQMSCCMMCRIMSSSMLWHLCNTVPLLTRRLMPFTGLRTPGSRSSHMSLMVMLLHVSNCKIHYSAVHIFIQYSFSSFCSSDLNRSIEFCSPLSMLIELCSSCSVIRASVPKMNLDDAFEQKNDIAKAVEDELEKVCVHHLLVS